MTPPRTARRGAPVTGAARRAAVAAAAVALLGGCVSVSVGNSEAPAVTYYVLADARPAPARTESAGSQARLAIAATAGDPVADSLALVYSRRPGERNFYQFAAWTERPSRRLAQLAEERLQARGSLALVTQLGQPLATDWLLTLSLDAMVHDVSSTPGRAEIALRAELIRRADRTRVAQRAFAAAAPVSPAAAAPAVAAFATAAAELLDELAPWVEAEIRRNR